MNEIWVKSFQIGYGLVILFTISYLSFWWTATKIKEVYSKNKNHWVNIENSLHK